MAATGDIPSIAAVLKRPRAGYLQQVQDTRASLAQRSGEAARQLEVFVERIGDLTLEEVRELHDETFRRGSLAEVGPLAECLVRRAASDADRRTALSVLAPALDHLDADRNPFAYVVRALCCLLLPRNTCSRMEHTSS